MSSASANARRLNAAQTLWNKYINIHIIFLGRFHVSHVTKHVCRTKFRSSWATWLLVKSGFPRWNKPTNCVQNWQFEADKALQNRVFIPSGPLNMIIVRNLGCQVGKSNRGEEKKCLMWAPHGGKIGALHCIFSGLGVPDLISFLHSTRFELRF